jgi:hypothetical protein
LQFSRGGAGVFSKSFFIFLVWTSLQLANEDAVYFLAAASQESTSLLCKSCSYVCLCTKRAANVDLIAQSAAVFF